MLSKTYLVPTALLVTLVHARFGQEGSVQAQIAAVDTGAPGEAATLAGGSIGTLLAGANPCDKLTTADKVAALGGAAATAAAQALVQAEKNFNPFTASGPTVCSDPTLPTTEALRGIIELVDPSVAGADAVNAASADSLTNPVDATGKSQADLFTDIGFDGFTPQAAGQAAAAASGTASGNAAAASGAAASSAATGSAAANASAGSAAAAAAGSGTASADASASTGAMAAATGANLQTFAGDLGAAADAITNSGDAKRPFEVNGDTFVNFGAAAQRTCDVQFNACANQANSGADFSVADCADQKTACNAAQSSASVTSFNKRDVEELAPHKRWVRPRDADRAARMRRRAASSRV